MPGLDYNWTDFLGRAAMPIDHDALSRKLHGKTILVTGAGGFIGAALVRRLASFAPRHLVLLDLSEHGLHDLEADFLSRSPSVSRELIVGDVCDQALLAEVFSQQPVHIVLHAAASKHVWLMESNPVAAARNNILGTRRVLEAATTANVERFVLVSTDKAVEPSSMMGATKRIAELIVSAHTAPMQAHAVRLGNVLGSTGSVVPLFEQQLANGQPLTISDPRCTRYFYSIDEVIQILLASLLIESSNPLLAPYTGAPRSITGLLDYMICASGVDAARVQTQRTGLRAGEKISEAMIGSDEVLTDCGSQFLQGIEPPSALPLSILIPALQSIESAVASRDAGALLHAMARLIPNYQPSSVVLESVGRQASTCPA